MSAISTEDLQSLHAAWDALMDLPIRKKYRARMAYALAQIDEVIHERPGMDYPRTPGRPRKARVAR
jgi:phage-related protein